MPQPSARRVSRTARRRRVASLETLEPRQMLAAAPVISEFMASNGSTLADSTGAYRDWIEIFNAGDEAVDLGGWHLTDNPGNLAKWTFPSVNLQAGEFLVVFASGCDVPGADCPDASVELHTNFELTRTGEYVALVEPDGATIVSSFGPNGTNYPRQFEDVSYGLGQAATLIGPGASARVLVPGDGALGQTWTEAGFAVDGSWTTGPTGVGYAPGGGGASVLALDFNDVSSTDGAADTQAGFTGMTIAQNGQSFGGVTVTLSALGGATLDDRDRATPVNAGALTTAQVYDDFIFANKSTFVDAELQVRLQGLTPGTPYRVTLWSYDSGSPGGRVSDWTEIASGTLVFIEQSYTFDGSSAPTSDGDDTMTANLTASPTGELILRGVRNGGTSHGVFLNALKVELAGIGGLVATNVGPQMSGVNASAYVRVPFDVPSAAAYDALTLRVKYDAGFVAYLNGQEVARRNAPTAAGVAPAFNAAATAERSVVETAAYETIDLSAYRNLLVDGSANVLAFHGLNSAAGDDDFLLLPELIGTALSGGGVGQYFETATPGAPNGEGVFGFVEDTTFSQDRGFYDAPFDVTIATPTAGANIYYTLDGSLPTATNAASTLYAGPVHVNTTTTLRAAAYKADFRPTDVDTQTYIFLNDVIRQGEIGVDYVEISTANTVGTVSGATDWAIPTANGASSTQWVPRVATSGTPFGTFTTAWESAAAAAPDGVPMITVSMAGLTSGESYNVFVNFWDGDSPNVWTVRAGLAPAALTVFTSANAYFTGRVSGNRILYNGLVGEAVADASGVVRMYVDDVAPNNGATRAFLDSVGFSQGEVPTLVPREYPAVWQGAAPASYADFAMDPQVVAQWDDFNPANTDVGIRASLMSIPTMSIVMDPADLWGNPTNGIYPNGTSTGTAWRRPGSIEYYDPATGEQFQYNGGVQIHGGASRDNVRQKKHSFRLIFSDDFAGPNTLNFPLFGDGATDNINTVVLRAFFTDGFATRTQTGRYSPLDSMYLRDVWMRETQLAMGNGSAHNTYVHLYINGLYWGLYNPAERPDEAFQAEYYGGQREDYDIVKDFNELFAGNRAAWDQMFALANQLTGSDPDAIYQQLQGNNPDGSRNAALPVLLDMDNFVDYMMLHLYAGAEDWPHHNWYAARSRNADSTGFKFFTWDQEIVLDGRYRDRTDAADANSPAELFSELRNSAAFRTHFGDRVQKQMFNGGPLSVEANQALWMQWADRIEPAIVAESARWGDARAGEVITVDSGQPAVTVPTMTVDHWRAERDNVRDNYFPQSHTLTLQRFIADGLYPSVAAPVYGQHGGSVAAGYELAMTDPDPLPGNTIYYTTDGSDPRVASATTATTLAAEAAAKRVLIPTAANGGSLLGDAWKGSPATEPFDDGAWIAGTGGLGYDEAATYLPYISPSLDLGTAMNDVNTSAFVRIPFTVDAGELATLDFMSLNVRYDDGFVAYLNGQEIARANADPGTPAWDAIASTDHADAEAVNFANFDVSAFVAALQTGANVLAIHGLNVAITSTDFLLSAELIAGDLPEVAISPTALPYTGPVQLDESATVRARTFSGGQWSALADAFFTVESPLRVSEIHYNPAARTQAEIDAGILDRDDFEFIELVNTSDTVTINLAGVRFADGIEFTFGDVDLAPHERIVVVQNLTAFEFRYGSNVNVAGQYGGTPENYRLSNGGEQITLLDANSGVIQSFAYDDAWYPTTDGSGPSLVVVDELAALEAWSGSANWRASYGIGGSPGTVDRLGGDFNSDLRVDLIDVAILQGHIGTASGATFAQGDANGDGAVDRADAAVLVRNFGRNVAPPPSSAAASAIVAEPRDRETPLSTGRRVAGR
ncbi:MAG: lamin tail domain-containing protein, partial [Pirellulales bacterium]